MPEAPSPLPAPGRRQAQEDRDYDLSGASRRSLGAGVVDHAAPQIDMRALRLYRLGRVQQELRRHNVDAILLVDPVLIRYATGIRNMQPWAMHSAIRTAFIPAEGKAIAFEYGGSEHLAAELETVAEARPAIYRFANGDFGANAAQQDMTKRWAKTMRDLLPNRTGGKPRLAIDRHLDYFAGLALADAGVEVVSGARMMSHAQSVKSAEEIACISAAMAVADAALFRMRAAIEPGRTEIDLWAILEQTNVEMGGEYMDTRLLSSGARTNPWYQEATERRVRPGELISIDTDMIGPFGYDADISRSFLCPPNRATGEQRHLYRLAWDQLHHNLDLVKPGASFRAMSDNAFPVPEEFRANTISMTWHGVGLYGQWPTIVARGHFETGAEDGEVVPGMVLCCESYIGRAGGLEGVKLEQQVLVTDKGYELLSTFPFEDGLLGREI